MENPTQPKSEATTATHNTDPLLAKAQADLARIRAEIAEGEATGLREKYLGELMDEADKALAVVEFLEANATPATTDKQALALETALAIVKGDGEHALTPDEVDEVAYQLGRFLRRTLNCFAPVITPNDIRNSGNEGAETLTDEEVDGVCESLDDNEGIAETVNEAAAELIYQAIKDREEGDAK